MVESRVDKIESFVRELVNKVMLQAMEILDSSTEEIASQSRPFPVKSAYPTRRNFVERKNRSVSMRGAARQANDRMKKTFPCEGNHDDCTNSSTFRRSVVQSANPRSRERNSTFDVDRRASEEIRKIVQGLQGVQIGDVSSVQPATIVSSLESDVKRAVEEISRSNEIPMSEGQGDVHDGTLEEATPIIEEVDYDAKDSSSSPTFEIHENDVDKRKIDNEHTHWQMQQQQQQDVTKLRSTCFLHRMIKELENAEASQENVLRVCNSISGMSQDRIAAWEENEEKFIRTIEGSKYGTEVEEKNKFTDNSLTTDEPLAISLLDDVPAGCIVEVEIEELDSRPTSATPPLPPSSETTDQLAEVKKKSNSMQQPETKNDKAKSKNKKSLGARLRKFFRTTFKRNKDC